MEKSKEWVQGYTQALVDALHEEEAVLLSDENRKKGYEYEALMVPSKWLRLLLRAMKRKHSMDH